MAYEYPKYIAAAVLVIFLVCLGLYANGNFDGMFKDDTELQPDAPPPAPPTSPPNDDYNDTPAELNPEMGSVDGFTDTSVLKGTIFRNGPCLSSNTPHNYIRFGSTTKDNRLMYHAFNSLQDAQLDRNKVIMQSLWLGWLPNKSGFRIGANRCVARGTITHSDLLPECSSLPAGYSGWVYRRDADGFCGERLV